MNPKVTANRQKEKKRYTPGFPKWLQIGKRRKADTNSAPGSDCKPRKIEKQIQEFEIQERKLRDQEEYNKTSENDEDIELKEKVDEFNSRRLTKENESKDNHMD